MHLSNRRSRFRFTSLTGAFMAFVLSLSLWAPAVHAETSSPQVNEKGQTKALTSESAEAFLDTFLIRPKPRHNMSVLPLLSLRMAKS